MDGPRVPDDLISGGNRNPNVELPLGKHESGASRPDPDGWSGNWRDPRYVHSMAVLETHLQGRFTPIPQVVLQHLQQYSILVRL